MDRFSIKNYGNVAHVNFRRRRIAPYLLAGMFAIGALGYGAHYQHNFNTNRALIASHIPKNYEVKAVSSFAARKGISPKDTATLRAVNEAAKIAKKSGIVPKGEKVGEQDLERACITLFNVPTPHRELVSPIDPKYLRETLQGDIGTARMQLAKLNRIDARIKRIDSVLGHLQELSEKDPRLAAKIIALRTLCPPIE